MVLVSVHFSLRGYVINVDYATNYISIVLRVLVRLEF